MQQIQGNLRLLVRQQPNMKPLTNQQLGEPLLKECVKVTSAMKKDHELAWKQYDCTLMLDGWTDMRGRHLINFLVNSPEGTYFLESVDASSQVHSATMLADLLQEKIEDIEKDNVVQVVTDNGANYKAVGTHTVLEFLCCTLLGSDVGRN
jgi:hypothetical protein